MKYFILPILFFLSSSITAQVFYPLEIPVFENGQPMANPWVGGMNAPQWSAVDLNRDGIQDLYAFDRHGHVHLGFINQNSEAGKTEYKQARYWLDHFPTGQNYMMLRDYNHDGAVDMFVSAFDEGLSGFKVYKGSYNSFNQLVFERILFPEYTYDIIPFYFNGSVAGPIEVYNNPDYPAIDDLDGDGDLDILTMNSGGTKVLYFKNVALESGFNDEVLRFELADDCWGKFGLTFFSQKLTLSNVSDECAFFNDPYDEEKRIHGGTTFCTFDNDGDGDKEVLYGDFLYPSVIFATNGGNNNQAWMTQQDTMFPSNNTSVDIPDFPSSFHIDVNNDGARDLLFCPNMPIGTPDINTVRWYENEGTDQLPDFRYRQSDFMVDGMLDFGTGANPVFVDVNADGLMDIVVGNRFEWDTIIDKSYLVLLINIGTSTEPAFEVSDRDWLGLSAYNPDVRSLAPAFGDLDGDGDLDLLIGDRQGFVHYLENTAGNGQPMVFDSPVFFWKDINVGAYSTPFIFDINKDGLLDLVIGERAGNINYLPNIGTTNNPDFHPNEGEAPNNQQFGRITTLAPSTANGYSQPIVLGFSDADYLISGSESGRLIRYKINQDSLNSGSFEKIDDQLGGLQEGLISRVSMANINGSDYLDAVIGNDRGGISIFQSPITVDGLVNNKDLSAPKENQVAIFPNPTKELIFIDLNSGINSGQFAYTIHNTVGQYISGGTGFENNGIDVSFIPDGIYLIEIIANGRKVVEGFVKHCK